MGCSVVRQRPGSRMNMKNERSTGEKSEIKLMANIYILSVQFAFVTNRAPFIVYMLMTEIMNYLKDTELMAYTSAMLRELSICKLWSQNGLILHIFILREFDVCDKKVGTPNER